MPSRKRQILNWLDKRTLLDIPKNFSFKGMSTLKKGEIASILSHKESVKMEAVLADLKISILNFKKMCMDFDLNPGAIKKQVLKDRIIGNNKPELLAVQKPILKQIRKQPAKVAEPQSPSKEGQMTKNEKTAVEHPNATTAKNNSGAKGVLPKDYAHACLDEHAMPAHHMGSLWKFKKDKVDEWMKGGGAGDKTNGNS